MPEETEESFPGKSVYLCIEASDGAQVEAVLDALDAYEPDKVSRSGLVGTEGGLMDNYRENEEPLCGDFVSKVMSNALKMGCNNACMKRIVAAPTAGACGVLPAVLVTYYKEYNVPEEKMIEAMYVAAGLGQIIANRATGDASADYKPHMKKLIEYTLNSLIR